MKKTIKNMAVVIIDVQNDFCSDKGITSNSGRNVKNIQAAVNNISRLLDNLRKLNTKIIFFKLIYDPKKIPLSHMQRMKIKKTKNLCQPNSKGIEFYNLKPLKNDKVMEKNYYSAFYKTGFENWLKKNRIKTVILTGVTTQICVLLTCVDAYYRGYEIYVLKDCVGTYEANDVALKYMREQCAANIIDSKNFIKSIRNFKKTDE
ncbi:TPA: cysteine hydrolase [Candidatus Woesearchaeota archaeon]|nr:cysteine hydrolase [Candidatus Woesearchaeota archaeon]HIH31169.1 cysteine hydrolase [Candidatus Woesearchaeota archaeon]HIH55563.1 cysteine hydrolase [Candidatus Woesearchaeota archaeon]HIJ01814.1 cysteine hydrolase [Candidatus Woesearchaeota archaeon]HIJ13109.1 cysteine hydrolase [Candidatus Woesearchaeota archaeon]